MLVSTAFGWLCIIAVEGVLFGGVMLSVESFGASDVVLLHGWGMHSAMWGDLGFAHTRVDLPGHGGSAWDGSLSGLDDWVDVLARVCAASVRVCAWSLGGVVALRWAERYPDQVRSLVLVASTPCFVRQDGWTCAMDRGVLASFSAALQDNYLATLRRFLSLQLRGGAEERALLVKMRELLVARGAPNPVALAQGLEILRDTDLRGILPTIMQPTLVIAGTYDTLTPTAASEFMVQALPNAELALISGAAHVPFLSHRFEFESVVRRFLSLSDE